MIPRLNVFSQTLVSWNWYQGFAPFCSILDYECSFWRWCWFMNVRFGNDDIRFVRSFLHPTFNHLHKEVWVHLDVKLFYFVHASCIQDCWELIMKKVCESLSFSFKLFTEVLPLVVIFDALKFCIEYLLFDHFVPCWCSTLKLSWSFVVLLMRLSSHGF